MKFDNLRVFVGGRDCTDECDFKRNGKANGFGWSCSEIYHRETRIGEMYCGFPKLSHGAYTGTISTYEVTQDEWDAAPNEIQPWLAERTPIEVVEVERESA